MTALRSGATASGATKGPADREQLRIAHIIGFLNIGGAERQLVNLLNAMRDTERLVVFIGRDRGNGDLRSLLDPAIEQAQITIRRSRLPTDLGKLVSLLKERRCNVVHTHMFWGNLMGVIAARLAGVPVIVTTEHGENRWKRRRHRWLERNIISRFADRRLCVSREILRRRVEDDRVPRQLLELVANGTALPTLEARPRMDSEPIIGAVGRLVPEKDYLTLLAAAARLREEGLSFRLCFVGDGPERSRLEARARELDLSDRVEFAGAVTNVDDWYRRFDVFVLSSVQEGLPVALLEAMSYGIACVATSVGAIGETLREGIEGSIVAPERPAELAKAISSYLHDDQLRARHGRAARERVRARFGIEAVASRHLQIYRHLIAESLGSERP